MIGVIADPSDEVVVREFFELFKTPWEFYRRGQRYQVLLCTQDCRLDETAQLIVFCAGRKARFDHGHNVRVTSQRTDPCVLLYEGNRLPIYGDTITFSEVDEELLTEEWSGQCVAYVCRSAEHLLARIGYDLFGEVRFLLTTGQPSLHADTPTLEWHIQLLRDLITRCGVSLVEIPPVPHGHQMIACLTHDVDHPSVRQHKWDHTMFGFLYRAVLGSVSNFVEGRLRFSDLLTNWAAALKLPLVFLGLSKDWWRDFDDRYLELEKDLSSTFFVIAFKDWSGQRAQGRARQLRSSRYEARDIADAIKKIMAAGCEIGVHGVDAWLDCPRGREEVNEIRRLTGVSEVGVRMHWLYYDQASPAALEKSGATYDSTVGYTDTVGYRAGTTQAYKPFETSRMLELPLHVMDTALFYPGYLRLSPRKALLVVGPMIDTAIYFGGCLTINWHDRSLFPERLWGECYRDLVEDLKGRGAWFPPATQAVAWFRKRRSAVFETKGREENVVSVKVPSNDRHKDLPHLRLRLHKPRPSYRTKGVESEGYIDIPFDESVSTPLGYEANA